MVAALLGDASDTHCRPRSGRAAAGVQRQGGGPPALSHVGLLVRAVLGYNAGPGGVSWHTYAGGKFGGTCREGGSRRGGRAEREAGGHAVGGQRRPPARCRRGANERSSGRSMRAHRRGYTVDRAVEGGESIGSGGVAEEPGGRMPREAAAEAATGAWRAHSSSASPAASCLRSSGGWRDIASDSRAGKRTAQACTSTLCSRRLPSNCCNPVPDTPLFHAPKSQPLLHPPAPTFLNSLTMRSPANATDSPKDTCSSCLGRRVPGSNWQCAQCSVAVHTTLGAGVAAAAAQQARLAPPAPSAVSPPAQTRCAGRGSQWHGAPPCNGRGERALSGTSGSIRRCSHC